MDEFVQTYWPVLAGFLGLVCWAIRLEAKVLYTEKQLESHKAATTASDEQKGRAIWEKFESIQNLMVEMIKSVSELKGEIKGRRNHDD